MVLMKISEKNSFPGHLYHDYRVLGEISEGCFSEARFIDECDE